MFLLDTNHCFRIVARDAAVFNRLALLGSERIATSVIVAGELRYGAAISQRREENVAAVEAFLTEIIQVPISPSIAKRYGSLKAALLEVFGPRDRARRRSFNLATLGFNDNDLWIAASTLDVDATLLSDDRDFERMSRVVKIKLASWR